MKCKPIRRVSLHRTRDAATYDAAMGPLRYALFRPGTQAQCKCEAGECGPEDCDELWICDPSGNRIACFYGSEFRAVEEENSGGSQLRGLCVYKMPSQEDKDPRTQDAKPVTPTLADINRKHRQLWGN
jgi:hypothetical protein